MKAAGRQPEKVIPFMMVWAKRQHFQEKSKDERGANSLKGFRCMGGPSKALKKKRSYSTSCSDTPENNPIIYSFI